MRCPDLDQLLMQYQGACHAFSGSVDDLRHAMPEEFDATYRICELARQRCEQTREALMQHRGVHGCDGSTAEATSALRNV